MKKETDELNERLDLKAGSEESSTKNGYHPLDPMQKNIEEPNEYDEASLSAYM